MNNEIPSWWLIISAIFFGVNIVFFAGLVLALQRVMKLLEQVTPKVNELSSQVSTLIVKVDRVAERVEEVAASVKDTVDVVGGRAKGIVRTVDLVTHTAGRQLERFSPYVSGIMAAIRLFKGFQEMRAGRAAQAAVDHKPAKR